MPNEATVPMYSPDGKLGDIPYSRMHDALQAGAKMAVKLTAPNGTVGYVPADRVQDAVKAGGRGLPDDVSGADNKPGFLSGVKEASGYDPNFKPSMLDTAIEGVFPGYDAARGLVQGA